MCSSKRNITKNRRTSKKQKQNKDTKTKIRQRMKDPKAENTRWGENRTGKHRKHMGKTEQMT